MQASSSFVQITKSPHHTDTSVAVLDEVFTVASLSATPSPGKISDHHHEAICLGNMRAFHF